MSAPYLPWAARFDTCRQYKLTAAKSVHLLGWSSRVLLKNFSGDIEAFYHSNKRNVGVSIRTELYAG